VSVAVPLSRAVSARVRDILRDNKRHGWTQDWLAAEIGMTQSMVSLILAGRRRKLGLDTWARIAHAIELPLSTLIAQAEMRLARETRDARSRSA
jgi:transcriptional regulator with XRE-family HTH domain